MLTHKRSCLSFKKAGVGFRKLNSSQQSSIAGKQLVYSAFTLIELIVLILIIILIVSILYPVFFNVRQKSYKSQCLSNLKQLGDSVLLYLSDHDQIFPMAIYTRMENNQLCVFTLAHALWPYIRNKNIGLCPADSEPVDLEQVFRPSLLCAGSGFHNSSYMANWCLFEVGIIGLGMGGHRVISTAEVIYPSETIALYDAVMEGSPFYKPHIQGRHQEQSVANFADGHSRAIKLRRGDGTILRGDGRRSSVYCLVEEGPYLDAENHCVSSIWGLADKRGRRWCHRCPGRSPQSPWYIPSTCGD
jgi:competence protein ComGC